MVSRFVIEFGRLLQYGDEILKHKSELFTNSQINQRKKKHVLIILKIIIYLLMIMTIMTVMTRIMLKMKTRFVCNLLWLEENEVKMTNQARFEKNMCYK